MNMKTSEILDLAADKIQERGWTHGGQTDYPWGTGSDSSPLCLEGGIVAAMNWGLTTFGTPAKGFRSCPAYEAVMEYLVDHAIAAAYDFNDAHGRTAEEVIAVLRAAAAVERVKEATYEEADQPLPIPSAVA